MRKASKTPPKAAAPASSRIVRAFRWIGQGRLVAIACMLGLVAFRLLDPALLETARLRTFDFYQILKPRERAPLPVVIVDIDERSLREIGQWPWPRSDVADLLRTIGRAGGIAVAFDILFAEPDRLSPDRFGRSIARLSGEAAAELDRLPNTDTLLAETMGQMRIVVGQAARGRDTAQNAEQPGTPVAFIGPDPRSHLITYPGLLRNIEPLDAAASGRGLLSILPDLDSIVRRVALVAAVGETIHPSLSVELLRVATGGNAVAIKTDAAGVRSVVVGGVEVPTDPRGRIWIHYTPHDKARFVSAVDLMRGSFNVDRIRNHLVLVGTSAIGLLDLKATPLDPAMPGVEVHAQILETILDKSYLVRPNYALGAEIVLAIALSLLVVILAPILGAIPVLFLGMAIAAATVGGSWYLYIEHRMLIDVVYPLMTSFTAFMILVFLNYRREEVQRQQIRSAFGQYLAPSFVEQIARNPERLSLGGETRKMTFLFSDVRDFTAISESYKSDPQGLTTLMNRFLTPLSDAILRQGGTIDKYMGDAIMAFWNAPLDTPDHAADACAAALEMVRRLAEVNAARLAEDEKAGRTHVPLRVGIGLNTGDCVVGNMGSEFRFDYSVMGDAVNLASRLEGQTKTYGVTIIAGAETARGAADDYAFLEIDRIRVKGKSEPETIHCLVGDAKMRRDPAFLEEKTVFASMLNAYRSQDWSTAAAALTRFAEIAPPALAGLVPAYRARLARLSMTPPGPVWDGVFTAETK
ncbi:adenylate/guanylate cyclase domain-containing protein [Stappia stellulata]|uniref:CHASE2 domain-containing protein n=1 Tax=Stappia stellulata TaxID=71235 RepID=UPI001CD29889|nr:adenylate/guanylate cyclase domain-containing protein [Stappia stellulata]MCA1242167.1 adenylate/guanylate cyclase domain-containing protein [Stappia stellulata]